MVWNADLVSLQWPSLAMRSIMRSLAMVTVALVSAQCIYAAPAKAAPCDGVDRHLTVEHKKALELEMAKQLKTPAVKVLEVFALGGWSIVAVEPLGSDVGFFFFASSPADSKPVAIWGGAAVRSAEEEMRVRAWVLEHSPGIPERLTTCFASTVTGGVDRMVPNRP